MQYYFIVNWHLKSLQKIEKKLKKQFKKIFLVTFFELNFRTEFKNLHNFINY